MNRIFNATLALTLTLSVNAQASLSANEGLTKEEVRESQTVAKSLLGRKAVGAELTAISEVIQTIKASGLDKGTRLAYNGDIQAPLIQADLYICVGGKFAIVILGFQGLKCTSTSGETIAVGFNGDDGYRLAHTGLIAEDYVGINVGVALNLGVLVIEHPVGSSVRGTYQPDSGSIGGGTLNGSYLLWGAMVGYYAKGDSQVGIFTWQPGFAAEVSASPLTID